jgi:hypothetical protein
VIRMMANRVAEVFMWALRVHYRPVQQAGAN